MIRLFSFAYSPFAAKIWKCLDFKGLPYELVEVPYLDRRELIQLTGGSIMVPVLVDGSRVVKESAKIAEYLDERYTPSLRPGKLRLQATVFERWSDVCVEDTVFRLAIVGIDRRVAALNGGREDARALWRFTKERKFGVGCIEAWAGQRGALIEQLHEILAPVGDAFATQPYLLGDQPTLADAALFGNMWMLEWAEAGFVRTQLPALHAWYERVLAAKPR
jgi:glutathione S-transferase